MEFLLKTFAELNVEELYKILQLRQAIFIIEQNCIYLDCDDWDKDSLHLFAKIDEEIIAYCRLLPKGIAYKNHCSIGRVVVKNTERKTALGKELMQNAIRLCKEKFNKEAIKISAQLYLQKFYTNLGFTTISEPYLEDDIPHIAMLLQP